MNSILLAKYLYKRAVDEYSPVDPITYGVSVSLLQDSAEMLVWEMAKYFNVQSRPKDGFAYLVNVINSDHGGIDLKQQIFELNQARVSFKHYGNLPFGTEVQNYINNCRQFLELNSQKIGVDFSQLLSADIVSNQEIRGYLKESEQCVQDGNFDQALIRSSVAFKKLEEAAYASFELGYWDLQSITDAYQLWPYEQQDQANDFTSKISELFEKITSNIALSRLGAPYDEVLEIKKLCYNVSIMEDGTIHTSKKNHDHSAPDENRVLQVNEFIVFASRRV